MRALSQTVRDPESAHASLLETAERLTRDISSCWETREREQERVSQRRQAMHRLESELLKLKRELSAARRVETAAAAAANSGAPEVPAAPQPALESILDRGTAVSRDAVRKQGEQIMWRWQELRQLEDKIDDLSVCYEARDSRSSPFPGCVPSLTRHAPFETAQLSNVAVTTSYRRQDVSRAPATDEALLAKRQPRWAWPRTRGRVRVRPTVWSICDSARDRGLRSRTLPRGSASLAAHGTRQAGGFPENHCVHVPVI